MSTPTKTDWIREFAHRSDESLWDEYVRNQRNWREDDGACHSAENVLSEVLTHRGVIAVDPNEALWAALEALFPNGYDITPSMRHHIGQNDSLFQRAREEVAKALTAAKRRGMRVGANQFVYNAQTKKTLTTEMPWRGLGRDEAGHAMVDVTVLAQRVLESLTARMPEFCKTMGCTPDQVEVKTSFLTSPDGQHTMRAWLERKR